MPSHRRRAEATLHVLAVWNFVLAMLWALWSVFWIFIIVYGAMTEKEEEEVMNVLVGGIILALPGAICSFIHLLAGFGLLKQRTSGYYFHIAGAIAAVFTCIGILYTIFALTSIMKPEVSELFFPTDYDDDFDGRPRRRYRERDNDREERRDRDQYEQEDEFGEPRNRRRQDENHDGY